MTSEPISPTIIKFCDLSCVGASVRYCVIECHYLALGNALAPPVHVEKVVADRQSYSSLKDLHLPPRTLDLEIDYMTLSFVTPQKVRFR